MKIGIGSCFAIGITFLYMFGFTYGAHAENRALLIGVGKYVEDSIPDLRGPVNDVLLMRDVLEKRGVKDIQILTDDVHGAELPTHAAILAAFERLADKSSAGDLVYVHLSGHGSRQIDLEQEETDGLDEIFLPRDVAKAPNGTGVVPNALTDDEIGQFVDKIRATGADVFLVMDSCHSGSGMRDVVSSLAVRKVDPDALGIDLSSLKLPAAADAKVASVQNDGDGWGNYQAFYATRSNDVAREVDMSQGAAGDNSQWYGLFTSALAGRLDTSQDLTYRQLFQSILADLNHGGGFGMAAIQTPLWEGNMIDSTVFGNSVEPGPARYLIKGEQVDAGMVHGLEVGTLMALVGDITDAPDAVIGYAQVEEVEPRRAYLRPVSRDCVPESSGLCDYVGSLPEGARFAQVELNPINQAVRFSPVLAHSIGLPIAP